ISASHVGTLGFGVIVRQAIARYQAIHSVTSHFARYSSSTPDTFLSQLKASCSSSRRTLLSTTVSARLACGFLIIAFFLPLSSYGAGHDLCQEGPVCNASLRLTLLSK